MDLTNAFNDNNGLPPGKPPSGIDGFDSAEPAPEYKPIPGGVYITRVSRGEYTTTKAGADAYRLRFEVTEGSQCGKSIIRTWTFSEKALRYTRRDLLPFG